MATTDPTTEQHAHVARLLEKTVHDALELGRAELALVKREVIERVRSLGASAVFFVVAAMFLQAAITTLGVLLVLMLRVGALGFFVVGGLAAVALIFVLLGARVAKQKKSHALARMKLDANEIVEAVK